MKVDLRNNRDFFAGLFFVVLGAVAMWMARDYPFGSALRMGPGYFPSVLGGIMIAFGVVVGAMGIKSNVKIKGNFSIRALFVLPIATVIFGYAMEHLGFIPALALLIPFSAAAGNQFKWLEVILLTVGITLLSLAIFIWGLGLPYVMIRGIWEY